MNRLEVTNAFTKVWASPALLKAIDDATSYPVEGARFSPAFKSHVWDGREHLLRKSKKQDCHLLPTGLLSEVMPLFDGHGLHVIDNRRPLGDTRDFAWRGPELRDYQQAAVAAALEPRGPRNICTGKGLLNLPIRSGKTVIAASLIQRTGLRTLFAVPSELLLAQSLHVFRELLEPVDNGWQLGTPEQMAAFAQVGDGVWEHGWITVATIQTLLKHPAKARELINATDLIFCDEAHHLEGPAWRTLFVQVDCPMKIGLSATVFVSRQRDNQISSIWLKACTGPILYRVPMHRLITSGHVMRPRVMFVPCVQTIGAKWSWQKISKELVAQSEKRNRLIADLAAASVKNGMRVLIDTGRKDQMKALQLLVAKRGLSVDVCHGGTPSKKRWDLITAFRERRLDVLIGTVFGEGIDIPELECVINAEGQKSGRAAVQRMRNLTPCEGKGEVLFFDIADIGNPYLQRHALARLQLYRGIRGFTVQVLPMKSS